MSLEVTWNTDAANEDTIYVHLKHPEIDEHTVTISLNRIGREWIVSHSSLGAGASQSRLRVPKRRHYFMEKSADDS